MDIIAKQSPPIPVAFGSTTDNMIDAAMAAATERFTAAEVAVITQAQALQIFQDTLLSTLPAEFSWDTFVPVFEAIEDTASAVGNAYGQAMARMDMNSSLNSLYGITNINQRIVTADGIRRTQYLISFSNGQSPGWGP